VIRGAYLSSDLKKRVEEVKSDKLKSKKVLTESSDVDARLLSFVRVNEEILRDTLVNRLVKTGWPKSFVARFTWRG
jgi:hypothetical protein